ncbi:MAG: hypothetical protein FWG10_07625 [Eubacteriaceae bacterium]|nr:hypothetical protein [Eubacteriaceae bacterium]
MKSKSVKLASLFFIIFTLLLLLPTACSPSQLGAKAIDEVRLLVTQDKWAIDFLVNLTENGSPIFNADYYGYETQPAESPGYTDFRDLTKQLEEIYLGSDAYGPFFTLPMFGTPQVFESDGITKVNPQYFTDFTAGIDIETIRVIKSSSSQIEFAFDIIGSDSIKDGHMRAAKTKNGWRLEESFYFYYLGQLGVSDIDKAYNWEESSVFEPDQNAGSSKRLIGKCMLFNVFFNDKESAWDPEAQASLQSLQNEAFRYLESQAAFYGQDLSISSTNAGNAEYFDIGIAIPIGDEWDFWADDFFKESTSYGSVNNFLEGLKAGYPGYDNYGIIMNVNKKGHSYSLICDPFYEEHENFYAERIVAFHSTDETYEFALSSATIAHELLHLFGAVDLYFPFDWDSERIQLAFTYFPFELMRYLPMDDINDAYISVFTAFRIGWRNTLPSKLHIFQVNH